MEELEKILFGKTDDTLIHSVLQKIVFDVRAIFIVDKSGSMSGWNKVAIGNKTILPWRVAQLLVTLGLLKMPANTMDELLIGFGSRSVAYSTQSEGETRSNQFMAGKKTIVSSLVDRTKSFAWNFNNLEGLINPNLGGTNFSSVAEAFKAWVDASSDEAEKAVRIENIQEHPLFIVVSDGDMNNLSNANASMRDFLAKMKHWFGWEGAVLVWDTGTSNEKTASKFEDIPNVFHRFGWNLGAINTMFKGIHDLDVLDIYIDLLTTYKSNRWEKIKEATL